MAAALLASLGAAQSAPAAAPPLIALSITGGSPQTICDTGMASPCITVTEGDLILCTPTAQGVSGEIIACHWSILFDGDDATVDDDMELNTQMRALSIAPNGSLVFVVASTDVIPGGLTLKSNDITVFTPADPLKPFVGGGPYTSADGTFKKYLDGVLTQQDDPMAKPWDALDLFFLNGCEKHIDATNDDDRTCQIIGSLTAGGTPTNFGITFHNEDLIRCVPSGFAGNGAVEGCDYSVMLDASRINGGGTAGITSDIEAIDFVQYDPATMMSQMVFLKKSGNPTGFPPHESGRDLLTYNGRLGSGLCNPSNKPCAAAVDCPMGETCTTGTCSLTPDECATDEDCSGAGNDCVFADPTAYNATVTLFFDGSATGLTGNSQKLEAFAVLPDDDGDGIPAGLDNCPNDANPPSVCSGPGPETCTVSTDCPSGETCVQADSDGDGVGDACDQCEGRPDPGTCVGVCPGAGCPAVCHGDPAADCACGDGVLDLPSETCDLGTQNGQTGSPCPANCRVPGKCKGSNQVCTFASECPAGEGCCGNGVFDSGTNEACDDGNLIDNDGCKADCTLAAGEEIVGCEGLVGPNVIAPALKLTKFKDTSVGGANLDRWKTKGDFNFDLGLTIDPDTQPVTITYSQSNSALFQSQLDPSDCVPSPCFVQGGSVSKPKWKFLDKEADRAGAPSWHKGKLKIKNNTSKFNLDGRNADLGFPGSQIANPATVRQTIRIGDVCITTLLSCTANGSGKTLKCVAAP